jgi:hypothetical protein
MRNARRSWLLFAAAVALAAITPDTASAGASQKLFFIARSKSPAQVHYDAQLLADGSLDPKHTVDAYWYDRDPDGTTRTGPIKTFEKIAYGWDTEPTGNGTYAFKLRAFRDRAMWIVKVNDRWRLQTTILGKQAYLNKLYVKTDESGVIPKVIYVDVYGDDAASGAALQEHIVKD